MSVRVKEQSTDKAKNRIVNFGKADFVAVEGIGKSFFKGKTKAIHTVQAEKLVASGRAKYAKGVELEEKVDTNRTVKDIKK